MTALGPLPYGRGSVLWRLLCFALSALLLAYGPVLLIGGGYSRLRYHYASSPYLGILAAALCWIAWPRLARAVLGGALAGFFTLNAAADIRQSWIPQSVYQRALEAELRKMKNLEPGDILIVSGTSYEIGTAQHFSMHSSVSAKPFAEWATGVAPLDVFVDVKDLHGRLMLFQYDYQRPLAEAEIPRMHVLVSSHQGTFSSRDWLAQEVAPGRFQVLALKGTPSGTGFEGASFSREQLSLVEGRIYFPKAVKSPVADK